MKHLQRKVYVGLMVVCVVLLGVVPAAIRAQDDDIEPEFSADMRQLINEVRQETAQYLDLETATDAGYGQYLDCMHWGDEMGMGLHFVHGELVGDAEVIAGQPEALVYEPLPNGEMVLVAFEYIIFADVWDPEGEGLEPPTLYGQTFSLKTTIPDTPPLWALHIWLWTHNPEGLFADYNPLVFCGAEGEPTIDMAVMADL